MALLPSIAVALAAIAVVGCGGSGPATVTVQGPSEATGATSTVGTPSPINRAEDKRTARAAVLALEDMPTGWHTSPSGGNGEEGLGASCPEIEAIREKATARSGTGSEQYESDDGASLVEQVVMVFPDEDVAQDALETATSGSSRNCVRDRAEENVAEQIEPNDEIELGAATAGRLNVDPLGAATQAFRVEIPYEEYGLESSVVAEIIVTRVDRGLSVLALGEPDEDLRRDTAATAARKLGAAIGQQ